MNQTARAIAPDDTPRCLDSSPERFVWWQLAKALVRVVFKKSDRGRAS